MTQSNGHLTLDRDAAMLYVSKRFDPNDHLQIEVYPKPYEGTRPLLRLAITADQLPTYFDRIEQLNNAPGYGNIYIRTNPTKRFLPNRSAKESDIEIIRDIHLDLDSYTPDSALAKFKALGWPAPSMVVESGGVERDGVGVQVFFRLTEPFQITSKADRDRAKNVVRKALVKLKDDPTTHNVSRLMRLPGPWNVKGAMNGTKPAPVKIISCTDEPAVQSLAGFEKLVVPKGLEQVSMYTTESAAAECDDSPAHIDPIVNGCAWLRHCGDDAETLKEPEWYAMLGIVGRCEDGEKLAHKWSEPHPKYTEDETKTKLTRAIKSAGPRTCGYISETFEGALEICGACPNLGKITSPIQLGASTEKAASADESKALPVTYPAKIAKTMIRARFLKGPYRTLARHCSEWQVWDGTAYHVVDDEDFKAGVRTWLESQKLVRHKAKDGGFVAIPVQANTNITNETIDAARALVNIPGNVEQPSWLNPKLDDPKQMDIIACSNGLLDIKTGNLLNHTPRWFSRNVLPFEWDPEATCEEWEAFLWDVSCEDSDWIRALQMWFGYLLTSDTSQQKMIILEGPPRSGKGVICRTLQRVLGKFNVCNPTLSSLCENFGLESLVGKTSAILADAHLGGRSDSIAVVERLKAITGEDAVDVNRKFMPRLIGVRLRTRFTISVNQLVNLPDSADAISSRTIILPFEKSYVGEEDLTLDNKLAAESPGILAWAVEGLQNLRDRKRLIQPERGEATLEDLSRLSSPISTFLADLCALGESQSVTCADLYKLWGQWCAKNGHKPGASSLFGTKLKATERSVKRVRGSGEGRPWIYAGVSINFTALLNTDWEVEELEKWGFPMSCPLEVAEAAAKTPGEAGARPKL